MNELDLLWQRHEIQHRLTVRVVEAFPEDKLFEFTPIAPMRTFAQIAGELLQLEAMIVHGVATGEWKTWDQESPHAKHATKAEIVAALNAVHQTSSKLWPQITSERLDVLEPSMWGGPDSSMRSRGTFTCACSVSNRQHSGSDKSSSRNPFSSSSLEG
jgi:hypothetical protein